MFLTHKKEIGRSILNGSSIRSENLVIELESFKESDAPNQIEHFCVFWKLCIVKLEKKSSFLTFKLHICFSILNGLGI